MKKRIALMLGIVIGTLFFAYHQTVESKKFNSKKSQDKIFTELTPQNVKAVAFGISEKVSSFAPAQPEVGKSSKKMGRAEDQARAVPNKTPFRKQIEGAAHDADSALANLTGAQMSAPTLSFDGLSSNDNASAYGFRIIPPDTNGDVGLNHYVQSVNSLTRVYDKNGNALTPPFKLSSIFAPLGTPCAMRDDGDPIVLYDALADRWMLSQYCNNAPPFRQMIAVSKTSDPTGAYFIYEFVMPNIKLNDYSKFGVWHDGYYMSTDEFIGGDYAGSGAFAFDREKILRGDPTASYIYFDLASPTTIRLGGLLPTDFDGLNAPPIDAPNIFVGYTANEYGDPQDTVRLFNFHADFANPNNSTFAERAESPLPVAAFDPTSPNGRDDIAQPLPGEKLDSQSDRLMYRVAYRNFGNFESLLFNQTVRVTPIDQTYRGGVRVYELRKTNGTFRVNEQATIGTNGVSRWMGSAAQDSQGNIAVGYSFGGEEKPPAILYTGKLAGEPTGTFRAESELISGTGVQKAFGFRWGDYSAMTSDPFDDCSFWLTNQYYSLESQEESDFGWLTRIGKFKFNECVPAQKASFRFLVRNAVTQAPIPNAEVKVYPNADPNIAPYIRFTQSNGQTETLQISPQSYSATVSAAGFRSSSVNFGPVSNITLIVNLQPSAVLENTKTEIIAESCAPNNTIEPGETVTLNIPLRNTGSINTNNLTATLLPSNGVLNPSATQNYGALSVNGASVSRPFTFTANPNLNCGDVLTLVLQLNDGAENLGTISINLQTGARRVAFSENFDNLPLPNLPPGWTTSATGGQELWKTRENRFQSPPNAVFSPDPRLVGVNELVSPVFRVITPNAELSFRNWYELETTFLRNRLYDGSVLDIKIGTNDWQDIEAAGGVFLSGGYDGVIDSCCQNPLAGRRGWSGRSGVNQTAEFITSRAKLPASAAGKNVQLRWRVGTDVGTFREGQYLDDIVVNDGFTCRCQVSQTSRSPFDFDGDGKTDLSVFRPSDSVSQPDFLIENTSNGSNTSAAWGSVGDLAVNADYDGDGKTDYAVFRPSTRTWFILRSSNNTILTANFGLADDKLAAADFDGDTKADIAVFRPSNRTWYILKSSDGQNLIRQFGTAEDLPAQADFDGDGKADIAVFRPSNGTWYVVRSSDGGSTIVPFGLNGDKPVVGDFDGDAKADFAVFRPSNRNWYILRSSNGFTAIQFGLSDDKPLQADFDGDGKRDVAVYRPSTGVWYYLKSSDGNFGFKQFGTTGDTAVPSIFVR
jgi:hypothetical protein